MRLITDPEQEEIDAARRKDMRRWERFTPEQKKRMQQYIDGLRARADMVEPAFEAFCEHGTIVKQGYVCYKCAESLLGEQARLQMKMKESMRLNEAIKLLDEAFIALDHNLFEDLAARIGNFIEMVKVS